MTKNLKQSFLLLLADLLAGAGELLKEHFGYSTKLPDKNVTDTTPPPPPAETEPVITTNPAPLDLVPDPNAGKYLDTNGVPFDDNMCGKAKDPYYSSGARKGQWKKKKGVQDITYDTWYAEQRTAAAQAPPSGTAAQAPPTNIAAGQFGAQAPGQPAVPETLGEFMAWIAEQQTVGKITPEAVNGAYTVTGVTFAQVNDPTTAKAAIAMLWNYLNTLV